VCSSSPDGGSAPYRFTIPSPIVCLDPEIGQASDSAETLRTVYGTVNEHDHGSVRSVDMVFGDGPTGWVPCPSFLVAVRSFGDAGPKMGCSTSTFSRSGLKYEGDG
jgi:hypothetical protein